MIDLKGGSTGTEIYQRKYNDLLQRIKEIPLAIRQQIVDALSQEEMDEFRQDPTAWGILTRGLSEVSGNKDSNQIADDGGVNDDEDDAFGHVQMIANLNRRQASD